MDSCLAYIQVSRNRWLAYSDPVEVIQADSIRRVVPALNQVDSKVAGGLYAAGFITYEASPAFDPALKTARPGNLPLLYFALFESVRELDSPPDTEGIYSTGTWSPDISESEYLESIKKVKSYISEGDTYQVNYSMRLQAEFEGDSYALFDDLRKSQCGRNCAYIDTPAFSICSASPELFIARKGDSIKSCPMKGTAARGLTWKEDELKAQELRTSEKNRAENVMIVDMIRNDMGRIAAPGSVHVSSSYDIERYPTVLQMTSTVRGETNSSITEVMKAMFPCASITGAPKVRTMEIISELEKSGRGIYTGSIGCMAPDGRALFNVAIRTVTVDKAEGSAEYGVGGGILWDSAPESEYAECVNKARVLTERVPEFRLLETMLWREAEGYYLLEEHLKRVMDSAEYFAIPLDRDNLTERLMAEQMPSARCRVRLLVDQDGTIELQCSDQPDESETTFRLRLAESPVDSTDRFLYHKTTNRSVYEEARTGIKDCDDVVLHNERGEITETTIANIVVEIEGRKVTPPVECGLLPGTLRAHMLRTGEIEEGVITVDQLKSTDKIWVINSVRGWTPASL